MRIYYAIGMLCLLGFHPLHAKEDVAPTIKELITQVQNAPDDQKRVLMNQLKTKLKQMSKENRKKAMKELKKSFATRESRAKQQNNRSQSPHPMSHQPKFRHLQRTQEGANRHQGVGHK